MESNKYSYLNTDFIPDNKEILFSNNDDNSNNFNQESQQIKSKSKI